MTEKKTAVVIGANGNLGKAVCLALENSGFHIFEKWRSDMHPDATISESYSDLPDRIDVAIYLAGVNNICNAEDLSESDWDRVLDVNLKGAFLFYRAAFPSLAAAGKASVISISSIMATHPYPGRLAYAVSKAGLEGLTRSLAIEWGRHGIATHAIRLGHLSGLMKTTTSNPILLDSVKARSPLGQLISPEQVANYITWVASGGAHQISGSIIDFDPAYTINRWPIN